jgi:hypothetical protein
MPALPQAPTKALIAALSAALELAPSKTAVLRTFALILLGRGDLPGAMLVNRLADEFAAHEKTTP